MASTPDGSSPPDETRRRKRPPPPTIELKATEVATSEASRRAASEVAEPKPASSAAGEAATPGSQEGTRTGRPASEAIWFKPSSADRSDATSAEPKPIEAVAGPEGTSASKASDGAAEGGAEPAAPASDPRASADGPPHERNVSAPGLARDERPPWPQLAGLAAGLIVVAVAGQWLVQALTRPDDSNLTQRVARLESRASQPSEPPALVARLTAAEQALRRLEEARQLEEARRNDAASRASPPSDGLGLRLDKVEQTLAQATDPGLANRIAAAEATQAAVGDRLVAADAATKVLTERLAAVAAAEKSVSDRLAAVETALRSLSDRVADLGQRGDDTAARLPGPDRPAVNADEQPRPESSASHAIRLALVAAALRDAVARGGPFTAELDAAKPLVEAARLQPLEPFAASGVPGIAALARELSGLVPAMVALAAPAAHDGGVLERLQASAERLGLVRIRRIDQPSGDDPGSVLARIETAAGGKDVDAGLSELAKLPGPVRAPAEAWIKRAEARRAALDAASRLAGDAATALGNAP
jgi:hypothetical protein